jgi:hypothetical protein
VNGSVVHANHVVGVRGRSWAKLNDDWLQGDNVMSFTGRGRADDHSNYSKHSAAAVQCSEGLCSGGDACLTVNREAS